MPSSTGAFIGGFCVLWSSIGEWITNLDYLWTHWWDQVNKVLCWQCLYLEDTIPQVSVPCVLEGFACFENTKLISYSKIYPVQASWPFS
jgi:hypothetical protein